MSPGQSADEPVGTPAATPPAVAAMMAADDASRLLGIELVECRAGYARTRMTVRADLTNGYDIAHGGVVFTLADTAFACACNSHGAVTVAAGGDITFIAPAREGDVLVAEAVERTVFGRSGIYDVTVRRGGNGGDGAVGGDGGDEIVAEFRGRSHRPANPPGTRASGTLAP